MNKFNLAVIFLFFVINSSAIAAELELTDVIKEAREAAVLMKTSERTAVQQENTTVTSPAAIQEKEKTVQETKQTE